MPQAIRLPPQPARCELCGRAAPLTRHHLIPRSLHDKAYVRKRFDRVSRITATLWVCRPCHNHIHQTFDEKTLALEYNSRELLLGDARIRQFVDWLAAKPDGFVPKR